MLSNVAFWALKKFIAPYFQNLDDAALKISVLEGKVTLENLHLKKEVLQNELGLPISVTAGVVGLLHLEVSWKNLFSKPIRAKLDEVTLIVEPASEQKLDVEKERQAAIKHKRDQLEALEKGEAVSADDDIFSSKTVFGLVNNLQVEVNRIHIRYEDGGDVTQCDPFAAGVTLGGIRMCSADASWRETLKELSQTVARKLLELKGFSIYMDDTSEVQDSLLSRRNANVHELRAVMNRVFEDERQLQDHHHILRPLAFTGHLCFNKKVKAPDGSRPPQFDLDLKMPGIGLDLRRAQFLNVLTSVSYFTHVEKRKEHMHYRPTVNVRGNASQWWQFAAKAATATWRRKQEMWSWKRMKKRRDKRLEYIDLYVKMLKKQANSNEAKRLKAIEDDEELSVNDIRLYRKIAQSRVPKRALGGGWIKSFKSWFSGSSSAQSTEDIERELTESRQELVQMLAKEEDYEVPKDADYIGTKVRATLDELVLRLLRDHADANAAEREPGDCLLQFACRHLTAALDQRPVGDGLHVDAELTQTIAKVYCPVTNQLVDMLVPLRLSDDPTDKSATLAFDVNPLRAEGQPHIDTAVRLAMQGHLIQVQPKPAKNIIEFFQVPSSVNASDLVEATTASIIHAQQQMRAGLEHAVNTRKNMDLQLDIRAPVITMSAPTSATEPGQMLVADLGTVAVRSEIHEPKDTNTLSIEELQALMYDVYTITLSGIKVVLSDQEDDWRLTARANTSTRHIIDETTIHARVGKCLRENDTKLPFLTVDGSLDDLRIGLSDKQIVQTIALATKFVDDIDLEALSEQAAAWAEDSGFDAYGYLHEQALDQDFERFLTAEDDQARNKKKRDKGKALASPPASASPSAKKKGGTARGDRVAAAGGGEGEEESDDDDDDDDDEFYDASSELQPGVAAPSSTGDAHIRMMEATFKVGYMEVQLYEAQENDDRKRSLSFTAYNLSASLDQRTYDMAVQAALGGVDLVMYTAAGSQQEATCLLYTRDSAITSAAVPNVAEAQHMASCQSTDQHFVSLQVTIADPKHPELQTSYDNTLMAVEADVSRLAVSLEQHVAVALVEKTLPLLMRISDGIAAQSSPSATPSTTEGAPTTTTTAAAAAAPTTHGAQQAASNSSPAAAVVGAGSGPTPVDMKVRVRATGLDFAVASSSHYLAVLSMDDIMADMTQHGDKTAVDAKLGQPRLDDFSADGGTSLYTSILDIIASDTLVDTQLVLHSNPPVGEAPLSLSLRTAPLRIFLLPDFLGKLMEFAQPVLDTLAESDLGEADAEMQSTEEQQQQQQQKQLHEEAMGGAASASGEAEDGRMHIDVLVASPTVIVPLSPQSSTALVMDFGSVAVTSNVTACLQAPELSKDPGLMGRDVSSALLYNHLLVQVSGVNLARADVDPRNKTKAFASHARPLAVLDDTTLELMLRAGTCATYEEAQAKAMVHDSDILAETALVTEQGEAHRFVLNQEAADTMLSAALGCATVSLGQTDYRAVLQLVDNFMASKLMQPAQVTGAPTAQADPSAEPQPTQKTGGGYDASPAAAAAAADDGDTASEAEQALPVVAEEQRLDCPHTGSMFLTVQWKEIAASLYLDQHASAEDCRKPEHMLTRLAVHELAARITMGATGHNEMKAVVTVESLSARDTLPRAGCPEEGYTILTTPEGMDEQLLEARFSQKRHTVRFVGDDSLDPASLLAPLRELGNPRSVFVQQNATPGVQVVVALMQNYHEAATAVKSLRTRRLAGVKDVDLGPSLDADAHGIFRGFVLYVSPELCKNLLNFFVATDAPSAIGAPGDKETEGDEGGSTELHGKASEGDRDRTSVSPMEPPGAAAHVGSGAAASAAPPMPAVEATPAYVQDLLNPEAEPHPLPAPTDHLRVEAVLEHPTVVVLEHLGRRARQFNVDFVLKAHAMFSGSVMFVDTQVSDFLIVSREGNDQSTRLDCIAPCCINAVLRQEEGKLSAFLDTDPISINLAYADVRTAIGFATALAEEYERLLSAARKEAWTQLPFRLSADCHMPPQDQVSLDMSASNVVSEESLTLKVPCVDVLLINTTGGLRTPLLCLSTAVEGTANNWSRALTANATMRLAMAAVDPKHSAWEPVLLREVQDTEPIDAYSLALKVERGDSGELDMSQVRIEKQSASRSVKRSDGRRGGDASFLLKQTTDTFWSCARAKKHSVIFDMERCLKLERFYYMPTKKPQLQPKESRLLVAESRHGPWTEVCRLSPQAQTQHIAPVQTPKFSASGRFWRWDILSRFSPHGACVSYVGFQRAEGGMNVALQTEDRMDVTITPNGIQHVTDIVTKWMRITEVGGGKDEDANRSGRVGTHKLINLTDRTLAFTPSADFEAEVARKHVVPAGQTMVFTPEREVLAAATDSSAHVSSSQLQGRGKAPQRFMTHVKRESSAITDIVIINASKKESAPPGYRVIEKNLNEGGSGDRLYLCYGSNRDQRPITDIQVSFVGMKGCITPKIGVHEPIPAGYEMINTNLNTGASGRDVFMSVFRGNGAPIVDLTVVYLRGTKNEAIPSDFYVLRKNLSAGQKKKENPHLCIKRASCRWKEGVDVKTVTGEQPITNLYTSIVRKGAKVEPQGPPDDDQNNPVYWDAAYDGKPFNINEKAGGDGVFLLRTTDTRFAPITALKIGSSREPDDVGWETTGVNMNLGNKGATLYLHYRREAGAPPVVEISFFYGNHAPEGYIVLFPDLNKNLSLKRALYMCYRVADVRPEAIEILSLPDTGASQHGRRVPSRRSIAAAERTGDGSGPAPASTGAQRRTVSTRGTASGSGATATTAASSSSSSSSNNAGAASASKKQLSRQGSKARVQRDLYALELLKSSSEGGHAIGLEVDGYKAVRGLPISEVGESAMELTTSSGSGRCVRLVVEVRLRQDVREVIVRSPLHLENGLKHAVDVCVPGYTRSEELTVTLKPKQRFAPPLGKLDTISTEDMLVPLLRFFDPLSQQHMYTTDALQAMKFNPNLIHVCTLGFLFRYQLENTVPLWITRLSPTEAEYDCFVNVAGAVRPGRSRLKAPLSVAELQTSGLRLAGYVYLNSSDADEDVSLQPIRRLYSPKLKDVLLATHADECELALSKKKYAYKLLVTKEDTPDALGPPMCHLVRDPGQVRVRRSEGQAWSIASENLKLSREPAQRELVCQDEARPFVCSLCPTSASVGSSFRIVEPLSFKNSLPVSVVFGLCADASSMPYSYVAVPPGGKCGFTSLVNKRQLLVRMAVVDDLTLPTHETFVKDKPHGLSDGFWSKPCDIDLDNPKRKPYTTNWVPPEQLSQSVTMLKLFLSLRREPEGYGPETAILYCPFQIVNNTDLDLSIRPRTTSGEPYVPRRPQPKSAFDLRRSSSDGSDTQTVWLYSPLTRVEETVISFQGFRSHPLDVSKLVAGNTLVRCFGVDEKGDVQEQDRAPKMLMIHWEFGDEDSLSRRLYIDPILSFRNDTAQTVYLSRVKDAGDEPLRQRTHALPPGLTWHDANIPNKTLWKLGLGSVSGWSGAFAPTELGVDVRVVHTLKIHNEEDDLSVVEADCFKKSERFVVTFQPVSSTPPMRVENFSDRKISFKQTGVSWGPQYLLSPMQGMNYALEDPNPSAKRELEFKVYAYSQTEEFDWVSVPFAPEKAIKLRDKKRSQSRDKEGGSSNAVVVVNVVPDTETGVLHYVIANDNAHLRALYGLPATSAKEELLLNVNMLLAGGMAVSLVDSTRGQQPREFALFSVGNTTASLTQTTQRWKVAAGVQDLQLDFQHHDALFPCVLYRRKQSGDKDAEHTPPIFELSFVQKLGDVSERAADSVEYFGAKLLPLEVKVDGVFLAQLLRFLDVLNLLPEGDVADDPPPASPIPLYCRHVFISPVDVRVTLSNAMAATQDLPAFFRTIGVTVPAINSAPFNLNSFELKDTLISLPSLVIRLGESYQQNVFRWLVSTGLVSTILSLDLLGDPLQVVRDVAGGFKSLFFNPVSSVLAGPEEFGAAVTKGVKDLGTGVVGGGVGMGAKVTGATGRGLAKATFDKKFQEERDRELRSQPTGAGRGFLSGMKMFGKGLKAGVSGIVSTPVREGKEGGVGKGLLGFGKGMLGLFVKPASGAVDLVSCTLRGIETSISGQHEAARARLPRHIRYNGQVVPYTPLQAQGVSFIHQAPALRENYADIPYVGHVSEVVKTDPKRGEHHITVFLALTTRLLVVDVIPRKRVTVQKEYDATQLLGFEQKPERDGIEVAFKHGAAVLKVCKDETIPLLANILRALINMHVRRAVEVETADTVFRPESDHTEIVEVYEYERNFDGTWLKRFMPADPISAYVVVDSNDHFTSLKEIHPSDGYEWVGNWMLADSSKDDDDAWMYARNLSSQFQADQKRASIRRRKWVREQREVAVDDDDDDFCNNMDESMA